jgi:hypothetical protein
MINYGTVHQFESAVKIRKKNLYMTSKLIEEMPFFFFFAVCRMRILSFNMSQLSGAFSLMWSTSLFLGHKIALLTLCVEQNCRQTVSVCRD